MGTYQRLYHEKIISERYSLTGNIDRQMQVTEYNRWKMTLFVPMTAVEGEQLGLLADIMDIGNRAIRYVDIDGITYEPVYFKTDWIQPSSGMAGWLVPVELIGTLAEAESVRVYSNSSSALTQNAWTTMVFATERWDDGNLFDIALSSRLTIPEAGLYAVWGGAGATKPPGSTWDMFKIALRKNGDTFIATQRINGSLESSTGPSYLTVSAIYEFEVDDYVELLIYVEHTDRSTLIVEANSVEMAARRLA